MKNVCTNVELFYVVDLVGKAVIQVEAHSWWEFQFLSCGRGVEESPNSRAPSLNTGKE